MADKAKAKAGEAMAATVTASNTTEALITNLSALSSAMPTLAIDETVEGKQMKKFLDIASEDISNLTKEEPMKGKRMQKLSDLSMADVAQNMDTHIRTLRTQLEAISNAQEELKRRQKKLLDSAIAKGNDLKVDLTEVTEKWTDVTAPNGGYFSRVTSILSYWSSA